MNQDKYMKHPKDQAFHKTLAFVMYIMIFNSEQYEWYTPPRNRILYYMRYTLFIMIPVGFFSQLLYLYTHMNQVDFSELAAMIAIIPATLFTALKVVIAQLPSYKKTMKDYMSKIHVYYYHRNIGRDCVNEALSMAEKQSRFTLYYLLLFTYMCGLGWGLLPFEKTLQNYLKAGNETVRLEVLIKFWLPIDYENNFRNWFLVQAMTAISVLSGSTIMTVFSSLNLFLIYHIIGHIKIFKYFLITAFDKDMSDNEAHANLKDLTQYYHFITQSLKTVEAGFGLNIVGSYVLNLVIGGILLYEIMTAATDTGTVLTFGFMIPIFMGDMLITAVVLENLRIQADDISDLVYALPWENMSVSNQRIFLLIIYQVQPPLFFKAAFNVKTGIQPAVNIIKTIFSYYVMIKARV